MQREPEGIPYAQIFDQSLNAISVHTIILDAQGRPVDYRFDAVNKSFEAETGLRAADILGKTVMTVLPGTEPEWIERYGHVALTGETQKFTSYTKELEKWYAVSAFRHKPLGFTVSFVDITERMRTEAALRDSEERLARVLEGSQLGYWDWDIVTGKVQRNSRWAEMLGYTLAEIELNVRQWTDLHHPDDREAAWKSIRDHLEGRTPVHKAEYRMRCKDGQYKWILDQARVTKRDADGRPLQMSGTHTDITDRKLMEEERAKLQAQLHQSQKLENLGSLAGGIAHDMNNVLAAILTLATGKLGSLPADDPLRNTFATISRAAERGGKVVRSLLEFARQRPVEEQALDLNVLIREEVGLLERTTLSKVNLVMDLAPDLGSVLGDSNALAHALMNLCINALDAMPETGTLTLRTRNVEGGWVEVQVSDTGTGMSPAVLEKALDPFFTTKPVGKGTGLGLSIVFSTVQSHHGTMEIHSEPGAGTLVQLRFPGHASSAPGPESDRQSLVSPGRLSILLVDDDELIRESLGESLSSLGHQVTLAANGEEALAQLEGGYRPAAVILDMNMPGLGGAGTLARIRSLEPRLPVFLATGRADQSALNLAAVYPGVTLLPKPFGVRELEGFLNTAGSRL